jgi:nitrite reductase/ring-hydroxylating ferredoxin subunit
MEFVEVAVVDDLADGQMRAVEVHGKRVLLAVVEGQHYAIGAVCTHERAHLDEGSLDGHEVYCPRHFSCFDVRTGEALEPPADRPTPVYAVKVSDGKVLVSSTPVASGDAAAAGAAPGDAAATERAEGGAPEAAAEAEPAEAAPERAAADGAPAEAAPSEEAPATAAPDRVADAVGGKAAASDGAGTAEEEREKVEPERRRPPHVRPRLAPAGPAVWQHRLLELAEDLPVVENGAEALGAALQPFRESPRGRKVFDVLHGRTLGHALHPALSDLPIGFWSGTVLLDTMGEHRAAGILGTAGVGAGVATAITGVADWTVSDGPDRRAGLVHGVLQTVALGVHGASLVARRAGRVGTARALAAAGLGLATGSAYLGGHLVFGRGLMVDHTAWHVGPRRWTRAIREDELAEGETRVVPVEDRSVLFSRTDDVVSAIDGVCSHAGGPLSRGKVEDGVVTCPWHGSCFRLIDGTVVRGPASHPQPILETRATSDGWIEVRARRR